MRVEFEQDDLVQALADTRACLAEMRALGVQAPFTEAYLRRQTAGLDDIIRLRPGALYADLMTPKELRVAMQAIIEAHPRP